ncbi:MAG TPA: acetyl-CoA carboxylase biotin carboxyl carrier protein [Spirochaetota bacterium]|nr:acetyl-CoA carboxylase biotin carboxyl carrier protein [Spirochaetota bacterium]
MKFKLMPKQRRLAALAALAASGEESSSDKIYNVASGDFANYAEFFEKNHLEELIIEEKGTRILFRKWGAQPHTAPVSHQAAPAPLMPATETPAPAAETPSSDNGDAPSQAPASVTKVVSPLNGTFYASASPDSPPFVSVGSQVSAGTVLCMVEAMKIFNELKSEVSGKVVKILAKNAEAVKEGQDLFWIE